MVDWCPLKSERLFTFITAHNICLEMGKKRDPSSPLDEGTLKKQNLGAEMEAATSGENEQLSLESIKKDMAKEIAGLREEFWEEIKIVSKKIGDLYIAHTDSVSSLNFHGNFLETLSEKTQGLDIKSKDNEKKLLEADLKQRKTDYRLSKVAKDVRDNTKAVKQKNLVINGLSEAKGENTLITAVTFLKNLVPDINSTHILKAYRVGAEGLGKKSNRPLIIQLKDPTMKDEIMKKKAILKNDKDLKKIFCNDDLPEESRKIHQQMREIAKYAVKAGYKKVKCSENKLQIGEKVYYANELFLLPKELNLENCKTRMIGGMLRFESDFSYLSCNYPTSIMINGTQFSSATQAFYYHKALMCGRDDAVGNILKCEDPGVLNKLGFKIEHTEEWTQKRLRVLKGILLFKFKQNEELRKKLCDTGDAPPLNCDPDLYWGTGWSMDSKEWDKSQEYPGRNALGIVLTDVRTRLQSECTQGTEEHDKFSIALNQLKTKKKQVFPEKEKEISRKTPNTEIGKSVAEQMLSARETAEEIKGTEIPELGKGESASTDKITNKETKTEVQRLETIPEIENPHPNPAENPHPTLPDTEAVTSKDIDLNKNNSKPEDVNLDTSGMSIDKENNLLTMIYDRLGSKSDQHLEVKSDDISDREMPRQRDKGQDLEEGWSIESITLDSVDMSATIDTSNLSLADGRLDREKVLGWTLPSLNSTAILEKSLAELKSSMAEDAPMRKLGPSIYSTPVNTKRGKQARKAKKQAGKNQTLQMLKDLEV